MNIYNKRIWLRYTKGRKSLFVMDSFRVHLTEETKKCLKERNSDLAIIPGECTSKVQPLDVSCNKPFKAVLRERWC